MPQQFTDSNGQRHILDKRKWRPATAEEVEILDEGFLTSTGRASREGFKVLGGLAQVVASFAPDRTLGPRMAADPTALGRFKENRAEFRQGGLERIAEASAALEQREDLTPGATTAATVLTEILPEILPGGIIAGAVRSGAKRGAVKAARNVAGEAAGAGSRRAAGVGEGASLDAVEGLTGSQADQIGAIVQATDSVGAARAKQSTVFQMMKQTPGLRQVLEKMEEFMATPRRISNDQRRMLESVDIEPNAVERVGLELLPGQAEGNDVFAEAIKSQPFMADAFDDVLSRNAKTLETKVLRAMGLPESGFGRSSLGEFDTLMRGRFQQVGESIDGPVNIPDELREILDDRVIMTADDARLFGLADEGPVSMEGADIMELRSVMNDALASANSDSALGVRSRHISQQLEKVDALIGESMPGGVGGDAWNLWKDTQQRWRVGIAANRAGVVDSAGDISIKRLANSLDRTFERDFKKNLFQIDAQGVQRNPAMPKDIAEMLDFTRVARAFESNLGDSGTATRQTFNKLLSGDMKGALRQIAAARFIKEIMLDKTNIPEAAKGIATRARVPAAANVNRPAAAGPAAPEL